MLRQFLYKHALNSQKTERRSSCFPFEFLMLMEAWINNYRAFHLKEDYTCQVFHETPYTFWTKYF